MKRRTFVTSALAAGTSLATSNIGFAQTPTAEGDQMTDTAPQTGYAPVNGLQMYYEIHGSGGETPPSTRGGLGGEPLLLLHGAYATIDLWGPILETLAADRQVIAVELQGHGHTADIDRPIRYETMGEDAAALLEHLGVAQADVVGYSLGANTGLQLAMKHPDLVRKLVVISGNTRSDAYYPEVLAGIQEITPEVFAGSPMEEAYLRNAPNPDDWPALIEKLKDLGAQEFAWPDEEIGAIAAPTLIIMGDSDVMRPEHGVEMLRLLGGGVPGDLTGLPNSQLAIIPGATHVSLVAERSDLWLPMVEAFLAAPLPETA